jgi:hypothetical protein
MTSWPLTRKNWFRPRPPAPSGWVVSGVSTAPRKARASSTDMTRRGCRTPLAGIGGELGGGECGHGDLGSITMTRGCKRSTPPVAPRTGIGKVVFGLPSRAYPRGGNASPCRQASNRASRSPRLSMPVLPPLAARAAMMSARNALRGASVPFIRASQAISPLR